jgi:hypothetical protein
MAAHRYWRVNISRIMGGTQVHVAEIEMHTSIGGADVCTGGTASASSAFNPASSAFDNDINTKWTALSAPPHWIKYDFGAGNDKDIVEFSISGAGTAGGGSVTASPADMTLEYSDDNTNWTALFTIKDASGWASQSTIKTYSASQSYETATNKRFWRIVPTAVSGGGTQVQIAELKMYASSPTDECTGGTAEAFTQTSTAGLPAFAFDGAAGGWQSTATLTGQWLGYFFASAKNITAVGITSTTGSTAPANFTIEYWDGAAYQTAFTITGATGWGASQTRYFDSTGEVGGPPVASSSARPVVFVCT